MVVLPAVSPVTRPVALTEATAVFEEVQVRETPVTGWPDAVSTLAVICSVPLIWMAVVGDVMVIDAGAPLTVIVVALDFVASCRETAVITAVPTPTAVTVAVFPAPATVATLAFEVDQETALLAPPVAATLAVSVAVPPTVSDVLDAVTVTLVTDGGVGVPPPPPPPGVTVMPPPPPEQAERKASATGAATRERGVREGAMATNITRMAGRGKESRTSSRAPVAAPPVRRSPP
jgi:hypothetical protein